MSLWRNKIQPYFRMKFVEFKLLRAEGMMELDDHFEVHHVKEDTGNHLATAW